MSLRIAFSTPDSITYTEHLMKCAGVGAVMGAVAGQLAYPSNMTLLNVCCNMLNSSELALAQGRVKELENAVTTSDINTSLALIGGAVGALAGVIYGMATHNSHPAR